MTMRGCRCQCSLPVNFNKLSLKVFWLKSLYLPFYYCFSVQAENVAWQQFLAPPEPFDFPAMMSRNQSNA
jgi:hypothetical protein